MKLIDTIEQYCKDNNIKFILGTEDYQNMETDFHDYAAGQLILLLDTTYSVNIYSGSVVGYSYNVTLALGRKFDFDGDEADLQEFYIQKYHKRLKELTELLNSLIANVACIGDFTVNSMNVRYEINHLDLNADFVAATGVISENV